MVANGTLRKPRTTTTPVEVAASSDGACTAEFLGMRAETSTDHPKMELAINPAPDAGVGVDAVAVAAGRLVGHVGIGHLRKTHRSGVTPRLRRLL